MINGNIIPGILQRFYIWTKCWTIKRLSISISWWVSGQNLAYCYLKHMQAHANALGNSKLINKYVRISYLSSIQNMGKDCLIIYFSEPGLSLCLRHVSIYQCYQPICCICPINRTRLYSNTFAWWSVIFHEESMLTGNGGSFL